MTEAIPWYDPSTNTWLTYSGEFNSYAEAWQNRLTTNERE